MKEYEVLKLLKTALKSFKNISLKDFKYQDRKTPFNLTCEKHGSFKAYLQYTLKRKSNPCSLCLGESYFYSFEAKAKEEHGEKFSYFKDSYKGANQPTKIKCKACTQREGEEVFFLQKPSVHLRGFGCSKCSAIEASRRNSRSYEEVYRIIKDNNLFVKVRKKDLRKEYINNTSQITYTCKVCREVKTMRSLHLERGHSCRRCKNSLNGYLRRIKYKEQKRRLKKLNLQLGLSKKDYKLRYFNKESELPYVCKVCAFNFVTRSDSVLNCGYKCPNCYPRYDNSKSKKEYEVLKYLKRLLKEVEISHSNRSLIYPLEVDFYIPEKKLAIEFNGVYWHSDKVIDEKSYHVVKREKVEAKGVSLLTIWEDQWVNKRRIVKSMLKAKLGLIKKKLYARKCQVLILEKTPIEFYNKNHLQGSVNCTYNIALTYGDKIVAVMSFGNNRNNEEIELKRFATKLNLQVIGGFSKLLKNACREFDFEHLISFSDNDYSDGGVYRNNGWEVVKELKEDYFYVDYKLVREHKARLRKARLAKKYPLYYKEGLSEREIVDSLNKYHRCYNSGKVKWSYLVKTKQTT